MSLREEPFHFDCAGERLLGIAAHPDSALDTGVLIVVGGPQYRIGSHRQFVLLARDMAGAGIPSMRFDFRGAGDATGTQRTYEDIGADISAAVAAFFARSAQLKRVVLWGLCGAASAALFYGYRDARVAGLVLVNPWVRTEEVMARTYLRHYYFRRLFEGQFWRKVLSGRFDADSSAKSLATMIKDAARGWRERRASPATVEADAIDRDLPLPTRMAVSLERFAKDVLIVLSGADYTAREFRTAIAGDAQWAKALERNRVVWHDIADSNHTFASRRWRNEVAAVTVRWALDIAKR